MKVLMAPQVRDDSPCYSAQLSAPTTNLVEEGLNLIAVFHLPVIGSVGWRQPPPLVIKEPDPAQ
eukprot:CAMPEP_0184302014 /NCGR_PEP_ID=MMETSP1049-20130417/12093_1 /TAXON_ID=77928 /ORGANISM="Proteomonas sulcata, Strain CCMP704" /LENGTH=63 /DNA_ID=CAMNT_0026613181 /DNA_START=293 /DNA_END=481 /DNA_ORIENTATION=-